LAPGGEITEAILRAEATIGECDSICSVSSIVKGQPDSRIPHFRSKSFNRREQMTLLHIQ
jgi:hypothetical protein